MERMALETQTTAAAAGRQQAMGHQALPGMGMAQGNSQGVGGVDLGFLGQAQQVHDHQHHLLLVRPAVADHGLLDLMAAPRA